MVAKPINLMWVIGALLLWKLADGSDDTRNRVKVRVKFKVRF